MTDREAFRSALRQSSRNLSFFAVQAYVVSFLPDLLGPLGAIIAGISVLVFIVFMGQALLSTLLGLVSLITWPARSEMDRRLVQPSWVFLSVLLTMADAAVYAGCIYVVGRSARWWGLL